MIAVLAAALFIGIVTASMLKNTGSQSIAALGYSNMLTMSSTLRSGMIATETYVRGNTQMFLNRVTAFIQESNEQEPVDIYGSKASGRDELSPSQYFSSKLIKVTGDDTPRGVFEIASGKRAKGKNIKKAYMFCDMAEVLIEFDYPPGAMGNNAILMGGKLEGGNNGMHVRGNATFAKSVTTNPGNNGNNRFVLFEPDADGNGSVFFNRGAAIHESNIQFRTPAFFNGDAVITGYTNNTVFRENVGFNMNVSTINNATPLGVAGDVWVREGFKLVSEDGGFVRPGEYKDNADNQITIAGLGDNNTIFYDNDPAPFPNASCDRNGDGYCTTHNMLMSAHRYDPDVSSTIEKDISDITTADILTGLGMAKEAEAVRNLPADDTVAALKARTANEPTLDMNKIIKSTDDGGLGKTPLTLTELYNRKPEWGGIGVSMNDIEKWYKDASPENYYNGHLIVKVDVDITFSDWQTKQFDDKIIFWVEDKAINSGYYNSGPDASTLIYVGENGKLSNFGTEGAFRGLVYVDEKNEKEHVLSWGANSSIDGAVLLKGGSRWNWNSDRGGQSGTSTPITRNENILGAFAGLVDGLDVTPIAKSNNITSVRLKPFGYYFFP